MKIDTTIKKRRFYLVQHSNEGWADSYWHTNEFLRYDFPSRAKVTFDGGRHTACYRVQEPDEPAYTRLMHTAARRMILQPSTRHIRGPQLTPGCDLADSVVILVQRDLLSVQFDADGVVSGQSINRDRLHDWCSDHLSGWFGFVDEGIGHPFQGDTQSFALFEDERDAIHFKLRWC